MRLVHTQKPGEWLELLLEPGSLYILRYCPAKEPPHYQSLVGPPPSTLKHLLSLSSQTLPSPTQQVLSLEQGCLHPTQPQLLFSVAETQPVMISPTRSFETKSPFLGSVEFPGADASL